MRGSLIEGALLRQRWVVLAGLALLTALSWAYVVLGANTGMSAWDATAATLFPHRLEPTAGVPPDDMAMLPGEWPAALWLIMLLMWWIMMIAMMTPSAAPMILLYGHAARHAAAGGRLPAKAASTAAFAAGYLLAWLGFSAVATVLTWALLRTEFISQMTMSSASAWLSAVVLIAAGIYQLSPLKRICLTRCRSPAAFLARHWRPGAPGALRMGAEHGLFCVGCCWMLMALLFVGGIMNLLWIGALALIVIAEKVTPWGPHVARLGGVLLLAWGAATLFA